MSEIRNARERAEITVRNIKTGKVSCHVGRYGTYVDCYEYAQSKGFALLQYKAI